MLSNLYSALLYSSDMEKANELVSAALLPSLHLFRQKLSYVWITRLSWSNVSMLCQSAFDTTSGEMTSQCAVL